MASYSAKVIKNFAYYLTGSNIQVDGDYDSGFRVFDLTNPYSKIKVPDPFSEYIKINEPIQHLDNVENDASKDFFPFKREKW